MVCVATFMIVLANFSLALYTVSVDGVEVGGVLQRKIQWVMDIRCVSERCSVEERCE